MLVLANIREIPLRDVLHFLGWRGTPVEPQLIGQIQSICKSCIAQLEPHVIIRRFVIEENGSLAGTSFLPEGKDIRALLDGCAEAVLMAATLGAQSERLLLKAQAKSAADALILDAVLSAAIEAVCDIQEKSLRESLATAGLYLTDRFSPGYGDMPLIQSKAICEVLQTDRSIGLSVSSSGIMLPRKSVTAVMGISKQAVQRRLNGCAACSMRNTCALSEWKS